MTSLLHDLSLARGSIDRAARHRTDPAWLAARWKAPSSRVLLVEDGTAAVSGDPPALVLVAPDALPTVDAADRWFLGLDGDVALFAVRGHLPDTEGTARTAGMPEAAGTTKTPWTAGTVGTADTPTTAGAVDAANTAGTATLREVGAVLSDRDAGLLTTAVALESWHRTHRHCPRCGARTTVDEGGAVRICPVDGSQQHPRVDPAVIMAVVDDDDRLLLGHQSRWPPRRFSTLAGFVEPGESLEQAVAREVHEETGVRVGDVSYVGSQPWPFPRSLMLGFVARARTTVITPDIVEIAEARWFTRDGLRTDVATGAVRLPPPVSIARRLIERWLAG